MNLEDFLGYASSASAVVRAHYHFRDAQALGHRVRLWGTPLVRIEGTLRIGDRVRITCSLAKSELIVERGAVMDIGSNVLINNGCALGATKLVRIGDDCSIGAHAILIDNAFHELAPELRDQRPESAPVILERNVWLAARVIVLPGVTVGENSVIGAGSVVTRDIPRNVLAAGVPARVIRPILGAPRSKPNEKAPR